MSSAEDAGPADAGRADPRPADPRPADAAPGGEETAEWHLPWPESPGFGPSDRDRLALDFAAAVRKTGSLMQLVGQAAADRVGVNATDLNCLNILSFSGQLTAGELARATGLTTASITGVIDRLEEAGFVRRERDTKDRRRVVVHLDTERVLRDVAPLFLPMMRDWRRLVQDYTDDELRLIVGFYGQMEQVFRDQVIRLRDPSAPDTAAPDSTAPDSAAP
jgi:DNA-binding MarR family transcriptional regulator